MQTQNESNPKIMFKNISSGMAACIQNCTNCYEACTQMITYCLEKGGKHSDSKHIQLLFDCAQVCNLSANFMMRNSESHSAICTACAEICEACSISCETLAASDNEMKSIVEVCRKCATSCSDMGKMQ